MGGSLQPASGGGGRIRLILRMMPDLARLRAGLAIPITGTGTYVRIAGRRKSTPPIGVDGAVAGGVDGAALTVDMPAVDTPR